MSTYLHTDRNVYAFRRSVPKAVRPYILTRTGKPRVEWLISLGTKDRREAERLCHQRAVWSDELIAKAQADLTAGIKPRPTNADELESLAWWAEQDAIAARTASNALEHHEWESREQLRQALILKLDRPSHELTDDERASRDLIADAEFDPPSVKKRMGDARAAAWAQAAKDALPRVKALMRGDGDIHSLKRAYREYAAGLSPATNKRWSPVIEHFVAFVGHDDLLRVSADDVHRWKKYVGSEKIKRGGQRSSKTIREVYLAALKATFSYCVDERLISANPVVGIKQTVRRAPRLRSKDFTDGEVAIILNATLVAHPNLSEPHAFARRWVPWLCAYTGARVNEITQLRAADVGLLKGHWFIRITPEAGSQKSNEARVVPLHEHLVHQGFPDAIKGRSGPLFYSPSLARGGSRANPQYKKTGERLASWVRELGVSDPTVQPNHAWRHLFKTRAKNAGMEEEAREAIPGHAASTEGRKYGENDIPYLAKQIGLLPRFEVGLE